MGKLLAVSTWKLFGCVATPDFARFVNSSAAA